MSSFQPALSIGNVGQLAVDLLISSLEAEKIGCLDDPNVLPCVGNDAYTPSPVGKLALPLEGFFFLLIIFYVSAFAMLIFLLYVVNFVWLLWA